MKWWNIPQDTSSENEYNMLGAGQWLLACHLLIVLAILGFVLGAFVFFSYLLFKHKFPSRLITYFRCDFYYYAFFLPIPLFVVFVILVSRFFFSFSLWYFVYFSLSMFD